MPKSMEVGPGRADGKIRPGERVPSLTLMLNLIEAIILDIELMQMQIRKAELIDVKA